MLVVAIALLSLFAGCMRLATALNPVNDRPCSVQEVNQGADRCDPARPEELPSGTD